MPKRPDPSGEAEPDYRPRKTDHLVEPMFEALRPEPEPEPEQPESQPGGRAGCGLLLVAVALGLAAGQG